MDQRKLLSTAGLIGVGTIAGQAEAIMIERPDLDQSIDLTFDPTATDPVFADFQLDLLPGNRASMIHMRFGLVGDLISQSSLDSSTFGASHLLSALVKTNLGNAFDLQGLGSTIVLPLNGPGPAAFGNPLSDLQPGHTQFIVFGFRSDDVGTQLYGYMGLSYERTVEANGDITARVSISDVAFDDDPFASSLQVVPEPASLAALAAGMLLAGGRRRDS